MARPGVDIHKNNYHDILSQLFPESVRGSIIAIDSEYEALHHEELATVRQANPKRVKEFTAGRACARNALRFFGIDNPPILTGEYREPVWPPGFVGSITHSHQLAGAVVAKEADLRGIGFDIENLRPLKHDIARHVCTESEKCWLETQRELKYNQAVILLFSIKESVYKCVHQICQRPIGFKDCEVIPNPGLDDATVRLLPETFNTGTFTPIARFHITSQFVFSGCIIPK